jgi:formylmethanofuran dehydrogenase subunit E
MLRLSRLLVGASLLTGCAGGHRATHEPALDAVARVHGAPGPWAVAGFRMGRYALTKLGLSPQSFDLEVVHHSPRQVELACIVDGVEAATGASLGKLNLSRVDADAGRTLTEYRRRSTGQVVALKPTSAFAARFTHAEGDFAVLGQQVYALPDAAIFEETTLAREAR